MHILIEPALFHTVEFGLILVDLQNDVHIDALFHDHPEAKRIEHFDTLYDEWFVLQD